jgi:hypothetical protein
MTSAAFKSGGCLGVLDFILGNDGMSISDDSVDTVVVVVLGVVVANVQAKYIKLQHENAISPIKKIKNFIIIRRGCRPSPFVVVVIVVDDVLDRVAPASFCNINDGCR